MLIPHPHQHAAINSGYQWLITNPDNGLVVAPVGAGKSLIIAEIAKRVYQDYPNTRILILVHVKELVEQDYDALKMQMPDVDAGIYCAKLNRRELHNDITCASIQSIYKKAANFPRAVEIVLVDEVHMISRNEKTTYQKFFADLRMINPNVRIMGFTGSPFRQDSGMLDEGDKALFEGRAYEIGIDWMIENGYLCRPVMPTIRTHMDTSSVKTRNGDYVQGELERAVDDDEITKSCVDEIIEHGQDRKKWLIFASGITHCTHIYDELKSRGVNVAMVTGTTPKEERETLLDRYKNGDIQAMVNVGVLTTGFNNPAIDLIAFMRPTRSKNLYVQMSGRGLRTHPGKENCLFLDFGNVIRELGPLDKIEIRKQYKVGGEVKEKKEAITKICPACSELCAPAQRFCYKCSYEFPIKELEKKADTQSYLLSSDVPPETLKVLGMTLQEWPGKEGKPSSLRVTYVTLPAQISEWIFFNHTGYARQKAVLWHQKLSSEPVPMSVQEAVKVAYPIPATITCRKEGKYWRVLDREIK